MLRQSVMPEGTVVWADNQVAGRGQRGKSWVSEAGKNLTMSLVLCPTFLPVAQQFDLTRAISLAMCDFLYAAIGVKAKIKWPNDIYMKDRKIAGILIENTIKGHTLRNSIVGIGLNVNQHELVPNATSMALQSGMTYVLKDCLDELCGFLESRYLQLKADVSKLQAPYLNRLYALNEVRWYELKGRKVQAVVAGVTREGMLQLDVEGGARAAFQMQEVALIQEAV